LYGLILDLAVGPQQSQAERTVEKQQAFDLPRLAVAVIEECDGNIERSSDLLETSGTDAVDALLVFLNLLEADAKLVAELRSRIRFPSSMSGLPALRCFIFFAADLFILVLPVLRSRSPRTDGSGVHPYIPL
jgi:hypothetical protein